MIKGFQPPPEDPACKVSWQLMPAIASGLIPGVILLVLPHASPWEGLTLFSPAILGRQVPISWGMPIFIVVAIHLGLSLIYGLLISLVAMSVRQMRALLVGGAAGVVLYALNLALVSELFPDLRGSEISVALTHIVFGLVAAGAYRGLLRRKAAAT